MNNCHILVVISIMCSWWSIVLLPISPHSPEIPNYLLMESYITLIEKLHVNKLISSHTKEIAALSTVPYKMLALANILHSKQRVGISKHR